jgi:release factor glutamine methyltransferase
MQSEPWTIKKILDWTTEHFKKHRIDDPHLEAEILLSHALKTERIKLYIDFEKEPDKNGLEIFKSYIARRIKREPAAYITGHKYFMSLDLKVTPDVLIPRPETELLIENAVELSRTFDQNISALDIGTGSGAIAVSLAKFIDNIEVCATDTSKKALDVALENAKKYKVENKIIFFEADLFPSDGRKFDIIISNPPYIRTADIKGLQPEVRDFEPAAALDGGADGLDYYRRIIEMAGNYLNENGFLMLEIGPEQSVPVTGIINEKLKPKKVLVKKDISGLDRAVIAAFRA